ncbi:SufD family Fe-S cluster assembly protein [Candidatus Micrarchaeota archaeon]|nr:SufD family Fe-S cluster assembly protein [Candidatus Micrarchaeota archaeon]
MNRKEIRKNAIYLEKGETIEINEDKYKGGVLAFILKENSVLKRTVRGKNISETVWVFLEGKKSSAELKSFIEADGKKVRSEIHVEHLAEKTISSVKTRAVLDNGAAAGIKGIISGAEGSSGNGSLDEKVLILNDNSYAEMQPELEIQGTGITGRHSAGIERINEGKVFYLMSRGMGKRDAERMIIEGFLV